MNLPTWIPVQDSLLSDEYVININVIIIRIARVSESAFLMECRALSMDETIRNPIVSDVQKIALQLCYERLAPLARQLPKLEKLAYQD